MVKIVLLSLICVLVCTSGQRITTIHLDGVQYFISRMNPYSPELNYFLAYQYCRSLGLQLASFETKEKAESMTMYLKNAGYGNYDFWTSGNRLGTGMFLWMSTGLPFNATFDFFENSADAIQTGLLDPDDHNSNTAPQRTARDSSSGAEKGCVILKQPRLKWVPEDCSAVKDFICEQTRCYYYNYGSIPVSSAQGRPVTSTISPTNHRIIKLNASTTPLPLIRSTFTPFSKRSHQEDESQLSFVPLKLNHDHNGAESNDKSDAVDAQGKNANKNQLKLHVDDDNKPINELHLQLQGDVQAMHYTDGDRSDDDDDDGNANDETISISMEDGSEEIAKESTILPEEKLKSLASSAELPEVEIRLKQISQEIEKFSNERPRHGSTNLLHRDTNDVDRQSFLSLTDLIRTLRPNDKQIIPQIDSDYSNAMRVLGEASEVVNNDDPHKFYEKDLHQ